MAERQLSLFKFCVAAVIVVILAWLVTTRLGILSNTSDHGAPIPVSEPDEANRKFHENGMSIIVPPGWRRGRWHSERDENQLSYSSDGPFPSWLEVELVDDSFNDSSYQIPWDFNGTVAKAEQYQGRTVNYRNPEVFIFEIIVDVDDQRYRVAYKSREGINELPQSVIGYIQSFLPPPRE